MVFSIPRAPTPPILEKYVAVCSKVGLDRFQRMINSGMKEVANLKRYSSPTVTPQALAWDGKHLWVSSRDLGTLYRAEPHRIESLNVLAPKANLLHG